MSYDEKCYQLAEHFLETSATEREISELAQVIQDSIEDFLGEKED